jgi:hypothetical protein
LAPLKDCWKSLDDVVRLKGKVSGIFFLVKGQQSPLGAAKTVAAKTVSGIIPADDLI